MLILPLILSMLVKLLLADHTDDLENLKQNIFHDFDNDVDGLLSEKELVTWLLSKKQAKNLIEAKSSFNEYDLDGDHYVTLKEHAHVFWKEIDTGKDYAKGLLDAQKANFLAADFNGDKKLDLDEFSAFLFPHNHKYMREIKLSKALREIDSDNDGFLSESEYLGDLLKDSLEDPDWLKSEQEYFSKTLDKNHDGKMDKMEIEQWMFPNEHIVKKAKVLLSQSDLNNDGKISKYELMINGHAFVGPLVKDFREYDEL